MRTVAFNTRRWRFLPKQTICREVRELDEVAFVRLLELRVLNDLLERNVLGRRAILPSPVFAWDVIVHTHPANERSVLIFFPFIADQVRETIPGFHCPINAVEESFKRAVLVVFGIANVEHRDPAFLKPVRHLEGGMENLCSFVPRKPSHHTSGSTARQELSGVKFIVQRYAVNVSKMLSPALESVKYLIPLVTWNANSRKDVDGAFR